MKLCGWLTSATKGYFKNGKQLVSNLIQVQF